MKKRINTTLVSIVMILISLAAGYFLANKFNRCEPLFNETVVKHANRTNFNCPSLVDDQTRFDNAMPLPGTSLRYNYSLINYTRQNFDTLEFQKRFKPIINGKVKEMGEMKELRDINTTIVYYYKDVQGQYLCQIIIRSQDYTN